MGAWYFESSRTLQAIRRSYEREQNFEGAGGLTNDRLSRIESLNLDFFVRRFGYRLKGPLRDAHKTPPSAFCSVNRAILAALAFTSAAFWSFRLADLITLAAPNYRLRNPVVYETKTRVRSRIDFPLSEH